MKSLLKTGDLFGAEFAYHMLPDQLDKFDVATFDRHLMEFYAVCTDVLTGEPVYKRLMHHGYAMNEWIRASASMPLASKVVAVEGHQLLDGGIADSIPLRFFEQQGYNKNVVVLTQPKGYVKKPNPLMPLIRLQLHRYPKFLKAAAERHIMYNEETEYVARQEKEGKAFVIRPHSILPIKHITHDPELMQKVYEDGRSVMLSRLTELMSFLSES